MCNKTILGAPFVGEFCVYGLQSVKPDTCFKKFISKQVRDKYDGVIGTEVLPLFLNKINM
jgi:hypothetical protein